MSLDAFLQQNSLVLRAIAVAVACNTACALLGCYLVLRRMSLIGDAISHGVLPGIALAFFLTGTLTGWPIIVGAMALGVLTAYLTQTIHTFGKVAEDASMGVVFTALFALGVVLVSQAGNVHLDLECVLYGDLLHAAMTTERVLGARVPVALFTLGPVLLLTLLFILALWKELKVTSFDPALATALGINATVMHYLLMSMVGGVAVASFEAVGSILVIAMLVVPAACAQLLTDRLSWMLVWASAVAAVSSALGYLGAEWLNTSPAGMMAVAAGGQFALAVLFAPRHGLLSKALRGARLSLRIACEDVLARLYRAEEAALPSPPVPEARKVTSGWVGRLAVPALRRKGQVAQTPEGKLTLTEAGRRRAESLVRSHRLWEAYLGENLGLPPDHLHEPAERMEHFIGPDLQAHLADQLPQSKTDPHGKAIPPAPERR